MRGEFAALLGVSVGVLEDFEIRENGRKPPSFALNVIVSRSAITLCFY
jgi:DNA-binding transcriptional regulator YiaG